MEEKSRGHRSVPKVSVLMPVYNGMPYLPFAVDSILNQDFQNFEFIIVNDCSTDGTLQYLNTLSDSRIKRLENERNKGVCYTLQRGLEIATGEYIARLDSDDIAYPTRLRTQLSFLEKNPAYGLVAASFDSINDRGITISRTRRSVSDIELRWRILFKNPIVHSTVMFRKSLIDQYRLKYELAHGEDYDLWNRMLGHTKSCILDSVLIAYRVHGNSWTYTKSEKQSRARLELSFAAVNDLLARTNQPLLDQSEFKSFSDWRNDMRRDTKSLSNIAMELKVLRSFLVAHSGNSELQSFRKAQLKRMFKRSPSSILLRPRICASFIKAVFQ